MQSSHFYRLGNSNRLWSSLPGTTGDRYIFIILQYFSDLILHHSFTPPIKHAGLLLTPGLCQLLSSPWDNSFFPVSFPPYLPQPKNICPVQWTWTWANFGRWWGTGRPGRLQSMGSQRLRHQWATEQQDYLIRKPLPISMSSFYLPILICFWD